MNCEICNGVLEVKEGGKAVCNVCGTQYSLERLREMIGKTIPQQASVSPTTDHSNSDTLLRMAESATRQGNHKKAIEICEEVLASDYHNLRAWHIKIEALCKLGFSKKPEAADCLAEACGLIADEKEKDKFIEDFWSAFTQEDPFDMRVAKTASILLQVETKLAEDYLYMIVSKAAFSTKNSCNDLLTQLKDMNSKAQSDSRYFVLMGQHCNNSIWWMTSYVDYAEPLMELPHRGLRADTELYNLMHTLCGALNTASKILSTRNDLPALANRALTIASQLSDSIYKEKSRLAKEQEAAAARYWQEHPDKRQELNAQCSKLQEQIEELRKELSQKKTDATCQQLENEIADVTKQLQRAGMFEFKKKKELQQRWGCLERQLYENEKELEREQNALKEKIGTLNQEIEAIQQKLANPPI